MAYTTIDDPTIYFNTKLYTGNGSTNALTGVGFQPDWVWLKYRSSADSHALYDSVRGTQKILQSDRTNAEITQTNGLSAFGSDGFTIGDNGQINTSSGTYVAWNWLAGGSASSNSDGSITSSVSANTTAGFSVVTYTGTGSAATVGHGLGSVPKVFWTKRRDSAESWGVYHHTQGAGKFLRLESTNAVDTSSTLWNNTTPTSSVFSIGVGGIANTSSGTYVAYCFAEKKGYSKFGSYIGGGSNPPFVYLGFKPAFFMVKPSSGTTGGWTMYDNAREPVNDGSFGVLTANSNNQELTELSSAIDFTSNGVKIRGGAGSSDNNASGATYIYMAFAESPFVTSSGVPTVAR